MFRLLLAFSLLATVLFLTPLAASQATEQTLHLFTDPAPESRVIFDASGSNLYGVTHGLKLLWGTVYRVRHYNNGTWGYKSLFRFSGGADGAYPNSPLIMDGAGNLYGAAAAGGINGIVFELSPTPQGKWSEKVLYNFADGMDGAYPSSGLISDSAGNFYGTTAFGGLFHGTVFQLVHNPDDTWTEKVLYRFTGGADGYGPSQVILDKSGNLFGTTLVGGSGGEGTIFELSPGLGDTWTFQLLYTFCSRLACSDGGRPSGIAFDSHGNLFGTTFTGGIAPCWWIDFGCGTVFKLAKGPGGTWSFHVLHKFCRLPGCPDGAGPVGLTFDAAGNVFGATSGGGNSGGGLVYKFSHVVPNPWTVEPLYSFCAVQGCLDGSDPQGAPSVDKTGNLVGTTFGGGNVRGVLYEITP